MSGAIGEAGGVDAASPVRRALPDLGPHSEGWVAIQTVIAVAVLSAATVDPMRWDGPAESAAMLLGFAACIGGVLLFAWGAWTLGPSFSVWVTPRTDARLVVDGPYRWTRHPICTAQAIFGFGWALLWASPLAFMLAVVYALYLDRFKLRREEETLVARYPGYAAYGRAVEHRMWPVPPRRPLDPPKADPGH